MMSLKRPFFSQQRRIDWKEVDGYIMLFHGVIDMQILLINVQLIFWRTTKIFIFVLLSYNLIWQYSYVQILWDEYAIKFKFINLPYYVFLYIEVRPIACGTVCKCNIFEYISLSFCVCSFPKTNTNVFYAHRHTYVRFVIWYHSIQVTVLYLSTARVT